MDLGEAVWRMALRVLREISGGDPLETAQRPLFRLLGPPAEHKHHALVEGGHMPVRIHDYIKEILDWFDRYLGPVTTSG
jgi:hypothetical protein